MYLKTVKCHARDLINSIKQIWMRPNVLRSYLKPFSKMGTEESQKA